MNRNPESCPHSMLELDNDTKEEYCPECGTVINSPDDEIDFSGATPDNFEGR